MQNNFTTGVLAASVLYAIYRMNQNRAEETVNRGELSTQDELVEAFRKGGIPCEWLSRQSAVISSKDMANRFKLDSETVDPARAYDWAANMARRKHAIETHELINKNRATFSIPNPMKTPTYVTLIGDPDLGHPELPGLADSYMYRYTTLPQPKIGGSECPY